nr:MAG TPA: hypothetical protein [Caudoviricetes sp.]
MGKILADGRKVLIRSTYLLEHRRYNLREKVIVTGKVR